MEPVPARRDRASNDGPRCVIPLVSESGRDESRGFVTIESGLESLCDLCSSAFERSKSPNRGIWKRTVDTRRERNANRVPVVGARARPSVRKEPVRRSPPPRRAVALSREKYDSSRGEKRKTHDLSELPLCVLSRAGELLSGSMDGRLCLWDVTEASADEGAVVAPVRSLVTTVGVSHTLGASGADEYPREVRTRFSRATPRAQADAHSAGVEDVAHCPHSPFLFASVGDDRQLLLWDARALERPASSRRAAGVHFITARIIPSSNSARGVVWTPSSLFGGPTIWAPTHTKVRSFWDLLRTLSNVRIGARSLEMVAGDASRRDARPSKVPSVFFWDDGLGFKASLSHALDRSVGI